MFIGNYIRIVCALPFIYLLIFKSIIRRVEQLNPFFFFSPLLLSFPSHQKKIQDAFTSRKRLAEEYEQLAIWYGDADMGSGKDKWQPSLPSTPATPLDLKNSQIQLPCDSEWELLQLNKETFVYREPLACGNERVADMPLCVNNHWRVSHFQGTCTYAK